MSVYAELVGQEHVIEILQKAVQATRTEDLQATPETNNQMTHAWVFTGPQVLVALMLQSLLHRDLSVPTTVVEHVMNVNLLQMAHTLMLRSSEQKVYQSRLMK